jgi:hypothetical protein
MSVSKLVTAAVLLMAAIVGLKIAASWFDYLQLKGTMRESAKEAAFSTEATVISAVLAKAKALHLPLDTRDIHLERNAQGGVRLWAEYDVTMTFPLGFSHTQRFRPEVKSGR